MKLFKKAKDLFKRMTGQAADAPPPVRPPPSIMPTILDPLPEYQQRQRDFELRARAVTVIHSGGTLNQGRNKAKRKLRDAFKRRRGWVGGWKKVVRLDIAAIRAGVA